ncbi:MAG: hypothetical protein ACRDJO_09885 [Actinomycetota bacterium]
MPRDAELASFLDISDAELAELDPTPTPVHSFEVFASGPAGPLAGGVVAVVSGLRDSPLLLAVRDAAEAGDAVAVGALLRRWRDDPKFTGRGRRHPPAITRLRYGRTPVVEGLAVADELDAMVALLPFAGGALHPEAFAADTWAPPGQAEADVETLVVYRQPRLTPLEERVLASLPGDVEAAVIGRPPSLAWPGAQAADRMLAAGRDREVQQIDDRIRGLQQEEDRPMRVMNHLQRQQDDDRYMRVMNHLDQGRDDQVMDDNRLARARAREVAERGDERAMAQRDDDRARVQDLVRQADVRQQVDELARARMHAVDDLAERIAAQQRVARADDQAAERQAQQQEADRQRQEQQRQQQEAEAQQRAREEEARADWQRREAAAAEADAGAAEAGDHPSFREWLNLIENPVDIEGLDARAAVAVLLEARRALVMRGEIR